MFNKLHIITLVLSMVTAPIFSQDIDTTDFEEEGGEGVQNDNCSDGWNNLDKKGKILYGTSLVILLILFCYFIFYTKGLIGILDLFSR